MKGIVYLIGAGPGDKGLLSAKGLQLLREADVVLYDRLANPLLLEETKADADLLYAGKLPDRHILRQEAIHDELVRQAEQGKRVVRLKGGDPSVFGRVGEEAAFLEEYGIAFEIVPGVTAGIAAPAYAGVPVTHRMLGTSFAVATGHSQGPDGLEMDWHALAQIDTVAFYMGVKNLPMIVEKLMEHGRSKVEPVLLIQWGATSKQRTLKADLSTIVEKAAEAGFENPAITLVGQVASLYKGKSWFEKQPLFGSFPMVFHDGHASDLTKKLEEAGAETFLYPRFKEERLDNPSIDFNVFTEIAFSEQGDVDTFFSWLQESRIDIRSVQVAFCAKSQSADSALRSRGLVPERGAMYGDRLWLGADEGVCEVGYLFKQTRRNKPRSSTKLVFKRLMEEESITDLILPSVQAVTFLADACKQDQRLQQLPVHCLNNEAFKAAKQLGLQPTLVDSQPANRLGAWINKWQSGQVDKDASHFICRAR